MSAHLPLVPGALLLSLLASACGGGSKAQGGAARPPAPAAGSVQTAGGAVVNVSDTTRRGTQPARQAIARSVIGEAAVVLNARGDNVVEVAAAGPSKSVALRLPAREVEVWADSVTKLINLRPRVREATWRAVVEDATAGGGGVTFTRKLRKGASDLTFFFSDTSLGGYSVLVDRNEAAVFAKTMKRAGTTARGLAGDLPKPAAKKKAPAKRTPAKGAAGKPAGTTAKPTTGVSKPATPATKPASKPAAKPAAKPPTE